MRVKKNKLND